MKRFTAILLLLCCGLSARAVQVVYSSLQFTGAPLTNAVTIQPWPEGYSVIVSNTNFISGIPLTFYPGTNGVYVTNLYPNQYRLGIAGIDRKFFIAFPDTTNTINLAEYVTNGAGIYTYTNNANYKVRVTNNATEGFLGAVLNVAGTLAKHTNNGVLIISNAVTAAIATNAVTNVASTFAGIVVTGGTSNASLAGSATMSNLNAGIGTNLTNLSFSAVSNVVSSAFVTNYLIMFQRTNLALDYVIASNALNLTNFNFAQVSYSLTNGSSLWRALFQGNATNLTNFQTGPLTLSLTNNDGGWRLLYSSNAIGFTNFSTNALVSSLSTNYLKSTNNLSELGNAATARINLGMSGAATLLTSNVIDFAVAPKLYKLNTSNQNFTLLNVTARESVMLAFSNTNAAVTIVGATFPTDQSIPSNGYSVITLASFGTNVSGVIVSNYPAGFGP